MKVQQHLLEIIEGKKSAPLTKPLLRLLSYGYWASVKVRNAAYDHGAFKIIDPGLPVISIGNIVAGGTGKTPLTLFIASKLMEKKKVAILSRGYRGSLGNKILQVTEKTPASLCGDESCLLAKKLPGALVFSGKDRVRGAWMARQVGAEILLLDDGMQHRRLKRSIEIVSMHRDNLFGRGAFLPSGLLRDDPSRLKMATLIALQGVEKEEDYAEALALLRPYTEAPVVAFKTHIENAASFANKKVAAFCGIAHPQRFFSALGSIGARLILTETLPDHAPFTARHLEKIDRVARQLGAELLVCTEKDGVKLPHTVNDTLPIETLKITLEPMMGEDALRRYL